MLPTILLIIPWWPMNKHDNEAFLPHVNFNTQSPNSSKYLKFKLHQISIDIRFKSYIPKPICGLLHLNGKKLVAHVSDHYIPKLNLMVLTCKNLITNPLTFSIVSTTQNIYGTRKKQWILKIL
jgi:hypothetical protein